MTANCAPSQDFLEKINNNNNDFLEKDGGTKNCIYKDLWSGIQSLVSTY